MKALTLTQPWATLVAIGAKMIETRSWRTSYRGPLAIHAARGYPRWALETCEESPFREALTGLSPAGLPRGAVIATCDLIDCVRTEEIVLDRTCPYRSDLTTTEGQFGDYSPGRFAWILEDVMKLPEPIPAKGALGLWEWERGA
jgi:hypothetical protein